ncbi:hypothetical protein T069G_01208 [Trichoderma breve]|uniref:Uncharacterized protein n=1 Tax=Trichoderma breve TaxID=2034170 RepID=A0A9W9EDI3_9HYPO|nr:hypothetical protein T069G_01208 [Trichoderma breve]KAJ4864678.1 hypothetical protein T069G_01208 [Trichoderma breve]
MGPHGYGRRTLKGPVRHISATTASPDTNTSSTKQTTPGNSRRRVNFHEDDDDREHKRQRTQSPAPAAPPVASSVRQPAVANSKTRSGTNDGDDDDKGNQRWKRQKIENTASDPTPPVSLSTKEAADGNVAKKKRRVSGRRKSRGQNSASGTLNPTSAEVGCSGVACV